MAAAAALRTVLAWCRSPETGAAVLGAALHADELPSGVPFLAEVGTVSRIRILKLPICCRGDRDGAKPHAQRVLKGADPKEVRLLSGDGGSMTVGWSDDSSVDWP